MKTILSTLTIIILFGIAMPTYGQQTKTHTWVAKVGSDGRNPGSVPWPHIIRYIKTNDVKTWELQLNATPQKFAIFCDSVWKTHAPTVSAAIDTTIKIISESHEEAYNSKIHGPLIEGNSGINKSTGELEVIYTPIPEGAMILVHPRLGPVAKSDCNNPLQPYPRTFFTPLKEEEKKIEPQRDVYREPEEEIEYVYFDSIVPVPSDTLHNLTVITTAAKATQSTTCTTCNVTVTINVNLKGVVAAKADTYTSQPGVHYVQPMQTHYPQQYAVSSGGNWFQPMRSSSGGGGVNIYNNNSNRNDIHFTQPAVSNYFNNQQQQQTYTPPSSGGRLPGNPGTSIDCCGDTGRKPFR